MLQQRNIDSSGENLDKNSLAWFCNNVALKWSSYSQRRYQYLSMRERITDTHHGSENQTKKKMSWPRSGLNPIGLWIDFLPTYGLGTSKQCRKLVTTGNTVISNCEKRNFRCSSALSEEKFYLCAFLVIFDMPSTNHFFRSFCSQVGMTMVLVGVFEVFVFGRLQLLYRDFEVSDGLDLSKAGWTF